MAARLAAFALVSLAAACGREADQAQGEPGYADVVGAALAALEAELPEPQGAPAEAVDGVRGEVRELLSVAAGDADLSELALLDIAALGAPAETALAEVLRAGEPFEQAAAAARALGSFDSAFAAGALLGALEDAATQPALRAHCAYALGLCAQSWVVPRLARLTKYETDREAWIWIAQGLAHFGNFSGMDGLLAIAASAAEHADMRAEAERAAWEIAGRHEFESPALLAWHWQQGNVDGRLPPEATSARQRLEIWRMVADLEDFQLRGVDDARYALSSLGVPAAHILAEALRDDGDHVRLHAAQTLARMGPRGLVAGSALIQALADPTAGVEAAHALGRIGALKAEPALRACLEPGRDLALRVAAARALGWIGLSSSAGALEPWVEADGEPVDLRAAAALAYLRTAPPEAGQAALRRAAALLEDPSIDPAEAETELGLWLERCARGDSRLARPAAERLEVWRALGAGTASGPQDPARELERRRARRELLESLLAEWPLSPAPPRAPR